MSSLRTDNDTWDIASSVGATARGDDVGFIEFAWPGHTFRPPGYGIRVRNAIG